jgi:hypothetical protein
MKEQEKLMLKKNYEKMSNDELLNRLAEGKTQYTEVAYELLLEEAQKRNITDQLKKPKELKSIEKVDAGVAINKAQKIGNILIHTGTFILFFVFMGAVTAAAKSGNGILASIIDILIDFSMLGWIGLLLIKWGKKLSPSQKSYDTTFNLLLIIMTVGFLLFLSIALPNYWRLTRGVQ